MDKNSTMGLYAYALSEWQFFLDIMKAITRCKWSGHLISSAEMRRVIDENRLENNSECEHCRWPVVVRKDKNGETWWISEF